MERLDSLIQLAFSNLNDDLEEEASLEANNHNKSFLQ